MAKNYPFLERINQALDEKNKTLKWLAGEIKRTDRWFYTIKAFEKVEFGIIEKISDLLEINFKADYDQWRKANNISVPVLAEPDHSYEINRSISVNIKIKGTPEAIGKSFTDLIKKLQDEAEKKGLEIE